MWFLRQSTASQEIPLGPFVDSTDGNTAETGLSIANTDVKLLKSGGTSESSKNSGGATHIAGGRYYCVLDATDTDTVGPLRVSCHVSGALAVWLDCCVLDEAVYDVLFGTVAPSTHTAAAVQALVAAGAVASVTGAVGSVTGDVGGKVLGGGAGTITGTGVRAVDGNGNAIAPASTALTSATWTDARAGYLDNLSGGAVMLAASYSAPPSAADIATGVDSALTVSHGVGTWTTATGFAVPGDPMALTAPTGSAIVGAVAAQITTEHGSGSYVRNTEPPSLTTVSASLVKIQAATYDSVTVDGDVITLSNGATQTIDPDTGERTTVE